MNKIYDKLLLAVAVLALLASVGFYVVKSAGLPAAALQLDQPCDHPHQMIPIPSSSAVTATWPDAAETSQQPVDELYDVFTPPKIWVNADGSFGFKSPIDKTLPKPPFGIYLAKIERDPYRLQIEGYIEEDLKDASKSLVLLFDEEQQQQVRARVGQEKVDAEFTLVDFTIERQRDASGNISKNVAVTLLDQRSGEEVILIHGERLYNESTTIILRSNEDASVEVVLDEAPQAFETPAGKYLLQEINLEASSVSVKKLANAGLEQDTETAQLYLATLNEPEISTAPKTGVDESQSFDFNF